MIIGLPLRFDGAAEIFYWTEASLGLCLELQREEQGRQRWQWAERLDCCH